MKSIYYVCNLTGQQVTDDESTMEFDNVEDAKLEWVKRRFRNEQCAIRRNQLWVVAHLHESGTMYWDSEEGWTTEKREI